MSLTASKRAVRFSSPRARTRATQSRILILQLLPDGDTRFNFVFDDNGLLAFGVLPEFVDSWLSRAEWVPSVARKPCAQVAHYFGRFASCVPALPINCAAILLHSLVHITRRSLFARPRATKLHHHQNRHSHPPPDGQCSLANAKFNPTATPRNQSLQGSRPPSIATLEAPPEIRRDKTPAPPRKANARMF